MFANRVDLICSSIKGRPELFVRGQLINQKIRLSPESYNRFEPDNFNLADDASSIITATTPDPVDDKGVLDYQLMVSDDEIPNLATLDDAKASIKARSFAEIRKAIPWTKSLYIERFSDDPFMPLVIKNIHKQLSFKFIGFKVQMNI